LCDSSSGGNSSTGSTAAAAAAAAYVTKCKHLTGCARGFMAAAAGELAKVASSTAAAGVWCVTAAVSCQVDSQHRPLQGAWVGVSVRAATAGSSTHCCLPPQLDGT